MPIHALTTSRKPAKKQAGTPCANHASGGSPIDTWRSGSTIPSKDWGLVTNTQYDAESRACYAWLYLPTATEKEVDTYGKEILLAFVEAGQETEAKHFMSEHLSYSHMFEHIKSNDELEAIKFTKVQAWDSTYLQILLENARAALVVGKFEYGNEIMATLVTALTVQLIQISRLDPALAQTGKQGGGKPSDGEIQTAAKQLSAVASGLKTVIQIYPVLIQQYRAKGELANVHLARQGWDDLQQRMASFKEAFAKERAFKSYVGFKDPGVSITEAMYINNEVYHHSRHKKWTLFGMDAESASVPVTPFNSKYDSYNSLTYETSAVAGLDTLIDQQELRLQLYDLPTIQTAFPSGLPDLQDRNTRIKVWAAVYSHYESTGGDPDRMTMYLIERYLKTYTRHSEFNISDFGESFVDRKYPTSLLGRAMQDCGVYAMSVASEMHAALELNGAKGYEFIIFFVPAHVIMIMVKDGKFFTINNDEIKGPHDLYEKGDLERLQSPLDDDGIFMLNDKQKKEREVKINNQAMYREVAKSNANMNNLDFWGSPMTGVSLGETGTGAATDFDKSAWQKYEAAAVYARDHQINAGATIDLIKDVDVQIKALKGYLIDAGTDLEKQKEFLLRHAALLAALFNSVWLLTLGSHYHFMSREYFTNPGPRTLAEIEASTVPHLSEHMGAVGKAGLHVTNDSPLGVLVTLANKHSDELLKLSTLPPGLSDIDLKQAQEKLQTMVGLIKQLDASFDFN